MTKANIYQLFHERALDNLLYSGRGAAHRNGYHELISNIFRINIGGSLIP